MTKLPSVHGEPSERTKAVIFIFVDQGEAGVALRGRGVVEGAHDDKDHCGRIMVALSQEEEEVHALRWRAAGKWG